MLFLKRTLGEYSLVELTSEYIEKNININKIFENINNPKIVEIGRIKVGYVIFIIFTDNGRILIKVEYDLDEKFVRANGWININTARVYNITNLFCLLREVGIENSLIEWDGKEMLLDYTMGIIKELERCYVFGHFVGVGKEPKVITYGDLYRGDTSKMIIKNK